MSFDKKIYKKHFGFIRHCFLFKWNMFILKTTTHFNRFNHNMWNLARTKQPIFFFSKSFRCFESSSILHSSSQSMVCRRNRDGGGRTSSLFELQDDGPHPADVLGVLGRFRIEVAKLGDPLPLRARSQGLLDSVGSEFAFSRFGGGAMRGLQLRHLVKKRF